MNGNRYIEKMENKARRAWDEEDTRKGTKRNKTKRGNSHKREWQD